LTIGRTVKRLIPEIGKKLLATGQKMKKHHVDGMLQGALK
jgi:hypothetical protein